MIKKKNNSKQLKKNNLSKIKASLTNTQKNLYIVK